MKIKHCKTTQVYFSPKKITIFFVLSSFLALWNCLCTSTCITNMRVLYTLAFWKVIFAYIFNFNRNFKLQNSFTTKKVNIKIKSHTSFIKINQRRQAQHNRHHYWLNKPTQSYLHKVIKNCNKLMHLSSP